MTLFFSSATMIGLVTWTGRAQSRSASAFFSPSTGQGSHRSTRSFASRATAAFSKNDSSNNHSTPEEQDDIPLKSYHFQGGTSPNTPSGATVQFGQHSNHHTVSTDLPLRQGGKNTAPQPVELLLGAWAGCTVATANYVSRNLLDVQQQQVVVATADGDKHAEGTNAASRNTKKKARRVKIVDLRFDVTAFRDERGALTLPIDEAPPVPSRLLRLDGTIHVTTKPARLSDEQFQLLHEQTELRCPVANMLIASGCQINVAWIQSEQ